MSHTADRRRFVKFCGATAVLFAASTNRLTAPVWAPPWAPPVWAMDGAPKVGLVDRDGKPIKAASLKVHENYIFHYPYVSTPCLLIRLDEGTSKNIEVKSREATYNTKRTRGSLVYPSINAENQYLRKNAQVQSRYLWYNWPGGVGKQGAVVSYSAICTHALSYDSKKTSFLNYRKARTQITRHGRVITCCAHGSVYDPAAGARVLAGPAEFPLAAVALEYDSASDEMSAVGMVGTELFKAFFKAYKKELHKEFGRRGYRKMVGSQTVVMPMKDYTEDMIFC